MYQIKKALNGGIINDTWLAEENGRLVIIQKVNTDVFPCPDKVMENMLAVTAHLKKELAAEGRNPMRETLTFLPDDQGRYLFNSIEGIFRKCIYIDDTFTLFQPGTIEQMREAGRAYGDFQRLLNDFPVNNLHETLPGFHNTAKRYEDFLSAVAVDEYDRCKRCQPEINYLIANKSLAYHYKDCQLPVRVTHNDTKISNLLFDKNSGKALAVIDLETVMPGYAAWDFGDAIRSGASSLAEDDPKSDSVYLVSELYQAFKEGFLDGTAGILTETELEDLDSGPKVIIYEQAMRFLTDYIQGDLYYKTSYPDHNLIRARNQIKLLQSVMETL